ncbi:MAG: Gfo/Idh/MocA family oxidoreductase [Roseburia sp.]|nr:Gfo/Idh/MocA family oxidoreductase [Roseburia sp.]
MYNFAVIGVGALGKRHLESILKLDLPYKVYVIDRDEKAVAEAVDMCSEKVNGGLDVTILPEELDVVIIATNSNVRRLVFEQLIEHSKVKNIIFEKVLFQKIEDYYEVEKRLQEHDIKAWINCARREQPAYWEFKEVVDKSKYFTFQLAGGQWGLGCNAVHMLDLVKFLSGEQECRIHKLNLLPEIVDSKRSGYKEIFGTISGECGKCQAFSIACYKDSTLPIQIEIIGDNFRAHILEGGKKITLMQESNGWQVEEREFPMLYVSQTTGNIINSILTTGDCKLPKFADSMQAHLELLQPLMEFFEKQGLEKGICPIT